jgi:glutaredoxin
LSRLDRCGRLRERQARRARDDILMDTLMTLAPTRARLRAIAPAVAALAMLAVTGAAHALYKVVGPDGKVTYTDRAPAGTPGQVTALKPGGQPAPEVQLPLALRQVIARYPVTLFTTTSCKPCEEARQLLRERGVPFAEKIASSTEDREVWERTLGGPEAPAVRIGTQILRGLTPAEWNAYLDAAGYPRASSLPPGYEFPVAEPLSPPRPTATARAPSPEPPSPAPLAREPAAAVDTPPGFKF